MTRLVIFLLIMGLFVVLTHPRVLAWLDELDGIVGQFGQMDDGDEPG
jgi:hypothetical protein